MILLLDAEYKVFRIPKLCLLLDSSRNHLSFFILDLEGFKATVRYVGSVAVSKNKQENWLGVEWDDSTRGKHDGSCVENGILYKYFDCKMGSGSFIKPSKVGPRKSFFDALNERYVTMDSSEITLSDSSLPGMFVSTSKGNLKKIELIGEKKLRKYQQISTIDKVLIRNDSIAVAGNNLVAAAHIIEVDLQDNLIWDWMEVFSLVSQMPSLKSLLLHGNKFLPLSLELSQTFPKGGLCNILRLALNNTGIKSWVSISILEEFLPNIEELYVAESDLWDMPEVGTDISDDENHEVQHVRGFTRLRVLDLTSCNIEDWRKVLSLGKLPSLEQLVLDDNPIPTITSIRMINTFSRLTRLSISSTKIAAWNDLNNLTEFIELENLRCSHIPLFVGMGSSEVRPLIIGRLFRLNVFNGSSIGKRERLEAEKTYLRYILKYLLENNNNEDFCRKEHPRYDELKLKHGEEVQVGSVFDATLKGMAADLVEITFKCIAISSVSNDPVVKRLPRSITIFKLRTMLKQLFGIDPDVQQLAIRLDKDALPTVLDDDDSTIAYYGAIDGSEIYVNEA